MTRYIIRGGEDAEIDAADALDDAGIEYDYDGGGRIMVDDEDAGAAETAFEEAGVDYDEV